MSRPRHIVLVPGLLGTALRGSFMTSRRVPQPIPVWSDDLTLNFSTLSHSPHYLHIATPLTVDGVIRSFTFMGAQIHPYFGPLIDHLASLGYSSPDSLTLFGYDWRQSVLHSAQRLHAALATLAEAGRMPIAIVAHSLGGLVSRLALSSAFPPLGDRTIAHLIELGTPSQGASKAYRALRHGQPFDGLVHSLLRLGETLDPLIRSNLLSMLKSLPSMFELLPPESQKLLYFRDGALVSALRHDLWADVNPTLLTTATNTHKALETTHACSFVSSIYTCTIQTEHIYRLHDHTFVIEHAFPCDGDGTVATVSAVAHTSPDRRFPTSTDIAHDQLPPAREVHLRVSALLSL